MKQIKIIKINRASLLWFQRFPAAAAKSRQSCPTLCNPTDGSPPGSRPWDSPGNYTGVGCHFLLQCMKVKSESEVAQSCPTLQDPMDCILQGSSIHGISQARVLEWGAIAFSTGSRLGYLFEIFLSFRGRPVSLWIFFLELLMLRPIDFAWLCFHCHVSQENINYLLTYQIRFW